MNQEAIRSAATVIKAVAQELARQALDSMPKLREGETITSESYADGVYYRETSRNLYIYDFKLRECRKVKGAKSA